MDPELRIQQIDQERKAGAIKQAFSDLIDRLSDITDMSIMGRHPNLETAVHHINLAQMETTKWLTSLNNPQTS